MKSAHTAQKGFTLIEVMVTIVITSVVFVGMFAVIRAGINTQMFVREMSDISRQGPAILSQISEDLKNAYFYNFEENDFFDGISVEVGDGQRTDQLHLVTTRSSLVMDPDISTDGDAEFPSPITEVSYMLKEGEDGFFELHRREQPFCDDDPYRGGYVRMISNRIRSLKIQYTGWDVGGEEGEEGSLFDDDEGEGNGAGAGAGDGRGDGGGNETADDGGSDEEDATLSWEDNWASRDKGALPVAVKIELVISPDIDPDVMNRMIRSGRLDDLDRSYIHIVLLPQFREDISAMRDTMTWDGKVAEPVASGGGVARGGARGDARGPDGQPLGPGERPQPGQPGARGARGQRGQGQGLPGNLPIPSGNRPNANNPFLNSIRGGNR